MAPTHHTGFVPSPAPTYYESFTPSMSGRPRPTVVMIHGGASSGACYQCTPDGRPGWAHRFVARGYPVVVPDWPGLGRSGHVPYDELTGERVVEGLGALIELLDTRVVVMTHSTSGAYGWRLLELHGDRIDAVVGLAPAPPGNIQPVTPIHAETATEIELDRAGVRLRLDKTAAYVPGREMIDNLIAGERFPTGYLAQYEASLLPVPPLLMLERSNLRGSQIRIREPQRLAGSRVLVVTGTHDSSHSRELDAKIVDWMSDHGVEAEHCFLGDLGITGNGHMMMLEDNSDEVADVIIRWLDTRSA